MKKFVTLTIALALTCAASAQLQRGNFLIGSDIANFRLGLNEGGLFDINLSPKAAIFVANNLALGAYLSFRLTTSEGAGSDIGYGIGLLGRYYINDPALNVVRHSRFFFEGNAGIEGSNPASGENTNGLGLGIGPGWTYFITPNVGLEALAKYQGIVGFGSRVTTSDLVLGVGFQIYLSSSRIRQRVEEHKDQ